MSDEEDPAASDIGAVVPPPGEPDRSLRMVTIEGVFALAHGALTGGSLVTAYALMLGATDFHLGLLTALGAIASVGALVGSQLLPLLRSRKSLVIPTAFFSRLIWILLCAVPFLPGPAHLRLYVFLGVVFLAAFSINMASNGWLSWMTDLVPAARRGRYFGVRNTIAGAAGMLVTYGVGKLYDFLKIHPLTQSQPALAFIPFYALSAVVAVLCSYYYRRQWEPPLQGERPIPLRHALHLPFRDRDFRRLILFFVLWGLVCAVAGPFFMPHMIKNLKMPLSVIAVYSIIAGACTLVTQPVWGRVVDRFGNRPVLAFNIVGVTILPLLWLFATPDCLWPIWVDAALTGLFWPGLNMAAFNFTLMTAPRENRSAYLAVYTLVTGFSQFLAALLGGVLAHALSGFHLSLFGVSFVNFHILFMISALGRIAVLPMARRLREDTAQPVSAMIGRAGDKAVAWLSQGIQTGEQVIRRLRGL